MQRWALPPRPSSQRRDTGISALQASKADAALLASYATNAALSASETTLQSALDAILAELAALQLPGGGVVNAPAWAGFTTWELLRGSNVVRNLHLEAPLSAALANGDDTLSITADCYSVAAADAALAAALLAYYTSSQVDTLLADYRTGTAQDTETTSAITAVLLALLHRGAGRRAVGRLPRRARRTRRRKPPSRARCWPTGRARTRTCSQPTKSPRRWWRTAQPLTRTRQRPQASPPPCSATTPSHKWTVSLPTSSESRRPANSRALSGRRRGRRGGGRHRRADPGPHTDVSLSNWTVRPSSGCSVVLATHTAGVSVDGYTLTPGRELLFACRYRLGTASNFVVHMSKANNVYDPLYGSFAGDEGAWSTAKMYFTVPPNGVAKLHFRGASRRRACPTRRQERWTFTASRSWTQPWRPATRRRRRTRRPRPCC